MILSVNGRNPLESSQVSVVKNLCVSFKGKNHRIMFYFDDGNDEITRLFNEVDGNGRPMITTEILRPYEYSYYIWKWLQPYDHIRLKTLQKESLLYLFLMLNLEHFETTYSLSTSSSSLSLPIEYCNHDQLWFSLSDSGIFESLGIRAYVTGRFSSPKAELHQKVIKTQTIYFLDSEFSMTMDFDHPKQYWPCVHNLYVASFSFKIFNSLVFFPNLKYLHIRSIPFLSGFIFDKKEYLRSLVLQHPRLKVLDVRDAVRSNSNSTNFSDLYYLIQMSDFVTDIAAMVEFLMSTHVKFRPLKQLFDKPLLQFVHNSRFDRNLLAIISAYTTDAKIGKKFF
jgi:hypothetical protein